MHYFIKSQNIIVVNLYLLHTLITSRRQQLTVNSGSGFGSGINPWGSASYAPTRAEALNINIFAAVLASLRGLTDFKVHKNTQESYS